MEIKPNKIFKNIYVNKEKKNIPPILNMFMMSTKTT